jgi:dihydrofolate reductase
LTQQREHIIGIIKIFTPLLVFNKQTLFGFGLFHQQPEIKLTSYCIVADGQNLFLMRKIVAGFAASLDGYIAGPNGEYDWIIMDKDFDFAKHMERFDAFFIGRKTYEMIAQSDGPQMPGVRNYVFSNTLTAVSKGDTLISGDIVPAVNKIKNEEGKDIAVFGGASLLASLLDHGLVDEMAISFIPVLLGKGIPMVDLLKEKVWLSLIEVRTLSSGTIYATYTVKRK